jgi:DNA repair exonuclease SbcCD ATPase subunit
MARIGVQFLDIEKAALELQGNGKIPTVDSIREILGTGSKSTIAQHLRAWRTKQTDTEGHLPHELMALVTGLWKRLHDQADQRIIEAQETFIQQIQESKQALTQLYQELTHLKKQLHQSEEMYANERLSKEDLEKQLRGFSQEHAKLNERHQAAIQHLEISKTENSRLHQLAANIQANLEHYQQTMQQRHIEQTLATEKQQTIYAYEMTQLKHQLTQQQDLIKPLEQELAQCSMSLEQLKKQNEQLLTENNVTQQKCQAMDRERSVLLERDMNAQKRIQAMDSKTNEDNARLYELEKKIAVLADHNGRLQQDLAQTQDKVETLRQEKLFLIQEKSQLEGYLQQIRRAEKTV